MSFKSSVRVASLFAVVVTFSPTCSLTSHAQTFFNKPVISNRNRVVLAEGGQSRAVIVLPDPVRDDPDRFTPLMVEQSGKVLAEILKRMTGAEFQIVHCADLGAVQIDGDHLASAKIPAPSYILVGTSDLTRKLPITLPVDTGSTYQKAAGNVLVITGVADGTLYSGGARYAVNQFLESQGVAYLWPGELGLVVPTHKDIAVPYGSQVYTPAIEQRGVRMILGSDRAMQGAKALGIDEDYQKLLLASGALQVPYVTRGLGGLSLIHI